MSLVDQIIYLFSSMPVSDPDYELKSILTHIHSRLCTLHYNLDSEPEPESEPEPKPEHEPEQDPELVLLITQVFYYLPTMKSNSELALCISRLRSLVTPMTEESVSTDLDLEPESKLISLISPIREVISLIMSLDLDLEPESELMSLVSQARIVFNSMDLDSQPKPLSNFISLISEKSSTPTEREFASLLDGILDLELEPEFTSLIRQISSLAISMAPKWPKLISLCPPVYARLEDRKIHDTDEVVKSSNRWRDCLPFFWDMFSSTQKNPTHFRCKGCNGENHGTYEKAPVEIEHPLHPKHSLQLVLLNSFSSTRECYCCGQDLTEIFYCCSVCDYAMNIACVEDSPVLSIKLARRHEHKLLLFPTQASLTCDLCALPNLSCPFYICAPCNFVLHQSCASLPYVIKISRHPHRISFTPSFDKGNWSCGICRREINNNYGGYSCIKTGCSFAAHSRCATQSNVWDDTELERESEEIEEAEEEQPFVKISHGIIQHFSHEQHHLKLDENEGRDYDENKQCQACVRPVDHGNYYSCMQCEFILHESCANLSRRIDHPEHSHQLTLMSGSERIIVINSGDEDQDDGSSCSACPRLSTCGFFYKCGKKGCCFKLHVQCALLQEPLVHGSHLHPLFLTSKPGEYRTCGICKFMPLHLFETFNCLECDFALCFACATLPQKARYKHDKHMLTLSYGEETSSMAYWCEACERKINHQERFYICGEYCCVTLHVECLIGKDLYMKPGASWLYSSRKVLVLPNNQNMSRPFCGNCEKRCPYNVVFERSGLMFCSTSCVSRYCDEKSCIIFLLYCFSNSCPVLV